MTNIDPSNVAWFDSDFVIIRDFDRREFLAYDDVPHTVFADFHRNLFQDRLLGDPQYDPDYARKIAERCADSLDDSADPGCARFPSCG